MRRGPALGFLLLLAASLSVPAPAWSGDKPEKEKLKPVTMITLPGDNNWRMASIPGMDLVGQWDKDGHWMHWRKQWSDKAAVEGGSQDRARTDVITFMRKELNLFHADDSSFDPCGRTTAFLMRGPPKEEQFRCGGGDQSVAPRKEGSTFGYKTYNIGCNYREPLPGCSNSMQTVILIKKTGGNNDGRAETWDAVVLAYHHEWSKELPPPEDQLPGMETFIQIAGTLAPENPELAGSAPAGGGLMVIQEKVEVSTDSAKPAAPPEEKPKVERRKSKVVIERRPGFWDPYTVRKTTEGVEEMANALSLKVKPVKVKVEPPAGEAPPPPVEGEPVPEMTAPQFTFVRKGKASPVKAAARSYKQKDGRLLIVSLYPSALKNKRTHLELRFWVSAVDFLEKVQVAAVTVLGGKPDPADLKRDSRGLRRAGLEFTELSPGSGRLVLGSLDPRPGAGSFNAGTLRRAEFGDELLGSVDLSWATDGVEGR